MNDNRNLVRDGLVFSLLVLIGVAGRWAQPEWCFTPTAAAAIFAGLYFSRLGTAALVPVAILAISDLLLPAHNSVPVMIATYAIMAAPVWFGRLLRGEDCSRAIAWKCAVCGFAPATMFFIVTNFAVWALRWTKPINSLFSRSVDVLCKPLGTTSTSIFGEFLNA